MFFFYFEAFATCFFYLFPNQKNPTINDYENNQQWIWLSINDFCILYTNICHKCTRKIVQNNK